MMLDWEKVNEKTIIGDFDALSYGGGGLDGSLTYC